MIKIDKVKNDKYSILFKPCSEGYGNSSGQGEIVASFNDLEVMFGKPAFEGIGDKITTEFVIDYEIHNEVPLAHSCSYSNSVFGSFTLYDWDFSRDLKNDYSETTWTVGGKSHKDSVAADNAIKIFKDTDVRYGHDTEVLVHETWHECLVT